MTSAAENGSAVDDCALGDCALGVGDSGVGDGGSGVGAVVGSVVGGAADSVDAGLATDSVAPTVVSAEHAVASSMRPTNAAARRESSRLVVFMLVSTPFWL